MSTGFTKRELISTSRRLLLPATLAGVGIAGIAGKAFADTSFTNFSYPATLNAAGGSRKDPDRWSDMRNVLDFGADPTGATDSSAAFQAAVNASGVGTDATTIYMPKGAYTINTPINLAAGLPPGSAPPPFGFIFRGEGWGTLIQKTSGGAQFVFDRNLPSGMNVTAQFGLFGFENFRILNNQVGGGGIRMLSVTSGYVQNCYFGADIGILADDNVFYLNVKDCYFNNGSSAGGAIPSGSKGIRGVQMNITGSQFTGLDFGIQIPLGSHVYGCRFEENNIGIQVTNSACADIIGCGFEANGIGIDLAGCNLVTIEGVGVLGNVSQETLSGNHWSICGLRLNGQNDHIVLTNCGFFSNYQQASVYTPVPALGSPQTNFIFNNVFTQNLGGAPGGSKTQWVLGNLLNGTWQMNQTTFNLGASALAVAFANLPSPPSTGDKVWIKDCLVTGNAAMGTVVTVGGGTHTVQLQYNGTNWTVIAV